MGQLNNSSHVNKKKKFKSSTNYVTKKKKKGQYSMSWINQTLWICLRSAYFAKSTINKGKF